MLDEQGRALRAVLAERRVRRKSAAAADPDLQTAAAHQVEHGRVFGHADRQLEWQGHDSGSEADPRRLCGDLGEEDEGGGQAALVFMEVVLRDPGRVVAEPLGMDDLRDRQPVSLGGLGLVEQPCEEPQAPGQGRKRHVPDIMHPFVTILPVHDWAAILPSRTKKVSVATSYTLSAVSAVHRMYA